MTPAGHPAPIRPPAVHLPFLRPPPCVNTEVILRKSLRLNFWIKDDDAYPGEDAVNVDKAQTWVMR